MRRGSGNTRVHMFSRFKNMVLGRDRDPTVGELEDQLERSGFSDWLPWVAYDPGLGVYINSDETVGVIYECTPLYFAGETAFNSLEGIFNMGLPEGSIAQFILYADPDIDPVLEHYQALRKRQNPLMQAATESFVRMLRAGVGGMDIFQRTPIRNFRLFVALKVPGEHVSRMQTFSHSLKEKLKGANLQPRLLPPAGLLAWMRQFFNTRPWGNPYGYNDYTEIRKQVILSESLISKSIRDIRINEHHFRCLTVKQFPLDVCGFDTNELFGGVWGIRSDDSQMLTPFLYSLNIMFENLKPYIYTKANAILIQQGIGAMGRTLARKKEEFQRAVDAMERGETYVRIIPSLWVWANSEEQVEESCARASRLWEGLGYTMQEDRLVLPSLLIMSMPFGLYNKGNNIQLLQRDFIVPAKSVVQAMPIQADYSGSGNPAVLLIGRKGQISAIDIFAGGENFNSLIVAGSGQGKSFLVNYITLNHYMMGDIIRIVDIGGSYKKMTALAGAQFLDFQSDGDLCINPFSNIIDTPDHPAREGLAVIPRIVQQMCYSATSEIPRDIAETGMTLIGNAVDWVWSEYRNEAQIDHVYEYLASYPRHCPDQERDSSAGSRRDIAHELAFNLRAFSSQGKHGRWFNGPANFDISRDEFVVLELEHLLGSPELFKVVILQLINYISEDLYLSDRSRRRLCFFDEAWRYITSSEIMADVIDQGMRRARKYGGSFNVITQSIMDLENKFGATGAVINANTANKFYLASVDFDKAKDAKLISYEEFGMRLLKSVQSNNPKYSEIFVHSAGATGPVRLAVNPFNYYMFTSSASEIAEIERLVRSGLSYEDAILEMVRVYRPGEVP